MPLEKGHVQLKCISSFERKRQLRAAATAKHSTGCKVTGCIVLAGNLVASGGHRVTACWLMPNACLQPWLGRLHA